jgi:hypothetical protein
MPRPQPDSWNEVAVAYERGGTVHANVEDVARATAMRIEYVGGQPCPQRCGTIIRYRVGRPRQESVVRHTGNPRACRQHPDWEGPW